MARGAVVRLALDFDTIVLSHRLMTWALTDAGLGSHNCDFQWEDKRASSSQSWQHTISHSQCLKTCWLTAITLMELYRMDWDDARLVAPCVYTYSCRLRTVMMGYTLAGSTIAVDDFDRFIDNKVAGVRASYTTVRRIAHSAHHCRCCRCCPNPRWS